MQTGMQQQRDNTNPVEEYIHQFPENVREILMRVRSIILRAAPLAVETIKYGIPTYVFNGNLVHFAAYRSHIGFYPAPSGIARFQSELSEFKCSTGAIQFRLDQPIPYDLIQRITEFRVSENSALKLRGKSKLNQD